LAAGGLASGALVPGGVAPGTAVPGGVGGVIPGAVGPAPDEPSGDAFGPAGAEPIGAIPTIVFFSGDPAPIPGPATLVFDPATTGAPTRGSAPALPFDSAVSATTKAARFGNFFASTAPSRDELGAAGTAGAAGAVPPGELTRNECPHFGHRIFRPEGGTRRSSI